MTAPHPSNTFAACVLALLAVLATIRVGGAFVAGHGVHLWRWIRRRRSYPRGTR